MAAGGIHTCLPALQPVRGTIGPSVCRLPAWPLRVVACLLFGALQHYPPVQMKTQARLSGVLNVVDLTTLHKNHQTVPSAVCTQWLYCRLPLRYTPQNAPPAFKHQPKLTYMPPLSCRSIKDAERVGLRSPQ
jgi:hypothetical protein